MSVTIDLNRALTDATYARSVIQRGNLEDSDRDAIVAKYGSSQIAQWESVDSTEYQLDDNSWDEARANSKDETAEQVGYSGGKNYSSTGSVLGAGASLASSTVCRTFVTLNAPSLVSTKLMDKFTTKFGEGGGAEKLSDIVTAILTSAVAAVYVATKPNKEQHDALMKVQQEQIPMGTDALTDTQAEMAAAGEELIELNEEAQEANEEANEQIEEDKTVFDFYKRQYDALKAKAQSGVQLLPEEQTLMAKLTPMMQEKGETITATGEETSDAVNDIYGDMEEFQEVYDYSAETIAEVEGITDYAEGFDSATRLMCYIEAGAQGLNAASATIAAARLASKGGLTFGITAAFALMAGVAAGISLNGAAQQFKMGQKINSEVHDRSALQEYETETYDVYEAELDNFAGNLEDVEDLELEMPEDLEVPTDTTGGMTGATTVTGTGNGDTTSGTGNGSNGDGVTGSGSSTGSSGGFGTITGGGNGNSGGSTPTNGVDNTNGQNYNNKMGYGADWSKVISGEASRNSDDEIVKDTNGKVVLTSSYATAIKSVTGVQEGDKFSTDMIPEILEKVLGSPFTTEIIKKVRDGEKIDSEYAVKFVGTKDQDERGEGTKDNSKKATQVAKQVIDFYYPIFQQAAQRGWIIG